MDAIKLSDLHANGRHADLEMSTVISDHDDEPTKLHGASGPLRRRLFFNILVSATLTFTIYYNYQKLIDRLHPLVAPALLGSMSAAFSILNSLWETGELISTTARSSYLRSLRYSYCYWPIFSVCLFLLVPPQMMFPANCLSNLLWNLILSRLT